MVKSFFSGLVTLFFDSRVKFERETCIGCVWQPLVYDAKSLSGHFYYGKKIEQRVCLKFCVSNESTATKSLKILQKYFGESTLSRMQVFEWHKAFSDKCENVVFFTSPGQI